MRTILISPGEGSRFIRGGMTSYCSEKCFFLASLDETQALAPRLQEDGTPMYYHPLIRFCMRPRSQEKEIFYEWSTRYNTWLSWETPAGAPREISKKEIDDFAKQFGKGCLSYAYVPLAAQARRVEEGQEIDPEVEEEAEKRSEQRKEIIQGILDGEEKIGEEEEVVGERPLLENPDGDLLDDAAVPEEHVAAVGGRVAARVSRTEVGL
jgi:hypothetical protein